MAYNPIHVAVYLFLLIPPTLTQSLCDPNPCLLNGFCVDWPGRRDYICICPIGVLGKRCNGLNADASSTSRSITSQEFTEYIQSFQTGPETSDLNGVDTLMLTSPEDMTSMKSSITATNDNMSPTAFTTISTDIKTDTRTNEVPSDGSAEVDTGVTASDSTGDDIFQTLIFTVNTFTDDDVKVTTREGVQRRPTEEADQTRTYLPTSVAGDTFASTFLMKTNTQSTELPSLPTENINNISEMTTQNFITERDTSSTDQPQQVTSTLLTTILELEDFTSTRVSISNKIRASTELVSNTERSVSNLVTTSLTVRSDTTEIEECRPGLCGLAGICLNIPTGFFCLCPEGAFGDRCEFDS